MSLRAFHGVLGETLAGLVAPLLLVVLILGADAVEGPKTAYVGVLAVVPMLAAVFARPIVTMLVGLCTLAAAWAFGQVASDGNVTAQKVRLVIIALAGVVAVGAATIRMRRERLLRDSLVAAARFEQEHAQARTDALTGILNRRGIFEHLESLQRLGQLSVAVIDLDGMKAVNDRFGHVVGDEYLAGVAGRLSGGVGRQDLVGRWGGDEFLIGFGIADDLAGKAVERVVAKVCSDALATSAGPLPVSVSVGTASSRSGEDLSGLLARADAAMYEHKRQRYGAGASGGPGPGPLALRPIADPSAEDPT